MLSEALQI